MNAVVTHHCAVPGCDWTIDQPVPQLRPTGGEVEVERFLDELGAMKARMDVVFGAHIRTHFLPEGPQQRFTVNALTNEDGYPAIALGEDVAALVLLTTDGMSQVIGRDSLSMAEFAAALTVIAASVIANGDQP